MLAKFGCICIIHHHFVRYRDHADAFMHLLHIIGSIVTVMEMRASSISGMTQLAIVLYIYARFRMENRTVLATSSMVFCFPFFFLSARSLSVNYASMLSSLFKSVLYYFLFNKIVAILSTLSSFECCISWTYIRVRAYWVMIHMTSYDHYTK